MRHRERSLDTIACDCMNECIRVGVIGSGISGASSAYWLHSMLSDDYGESRTRALKHSACLYRGFQLFAISSLQCHRCVVTVRADVRVTVWERDHRVGGRIQDAVIDGVHLEGGASIMHDSNRYMRDFARELNLALHEPPPKLAGTTGVWNGNEMVLQLGTHGDGYLGQAWDAFQILWRYGLDFLRLEQIVRRVATAFTSVYALQDSYAFFDSPRDLLHAMGVWEPTQMSLHRWVHEQKEWTSGCDRSTPQAHLLLDELAVAATRVNYGQDLEINALAGAVGLIPMTNPKLWSVAGGNTRVVEGLLRLARANVKMGHSVASVERVGQRGDDASSGELRVQGNRLAHDPVQSGNTTADQADTFSDTVDVLVVATPLEFTPELRFRIPRTLEQGEADTDTDADAGSDESFQSQPYPSRKRPHLYQTTHATFLSGRLRPQAFGLRGEEDLPATVLTTESVSVSFTSISAYAQDATTGRRVYKVFSREELTPARVAHLFDDVSEGSVQRLAWKAYPRYESAESFAPSFRLYSHVWYPLALEPAASCMEVQSIAARNVALAIAHEWREKTRSGQFAHRALGRSMQEQLCNVRPTRLIFVLWCCLCSLFQNDSWRTSMTSSNLARAAAALRNRIRSMPARKICSTIANCFNVSKERSNKCLKKDF